MDKKISIKCTKDNFSWSNGLGVWGGPNTNFVRSWAQKNYDWSYFDGPNSFLLLTFLELGQAFIKPWAQKSLDWSTKFFS